MDATIDNPELGGTSNNSIVSNITRGGGDNEE